MFIPEIENRVVNLLSLNMLGCWQENHMFIFIVAVLLDKGEGTN